ncbi:Uncharacterised protein [Legionella beliardensis]|uniref:Uncharacterized protein n=1 Tax=Legionella beliardensis TaxID=91822 RepID=A0A378I4K6_9GAMM|nr:hypothetical protein [Legionella beliardensis]STX29943.1 Uncharacterised protein [Legionella beliardensis]
MEQKLEYSPNFFLVIKNTDTVPAFLYSIKIYESLIEAVHGGGRYITEVFIPSRQAILNSEHYILASDMPRNKMASLVDKETIVPLTEVKISKNLAQKITGIIKLTEEKACLKQEWLLLSQAHDIFEPVHVIKYKMKIYEDLMDAIHDGGHYITECFIPSH